MNSTTKLGNLNLSKMIPSARNAPIAIAALVCCLAFSQWTIAQEPTTHSSNLQQSKQIRAILDRQVKAWNEGDLVQFMQTYWKSEKLTFSGGGKTTRGWEATLKNYQRGYATKSKMGHLHFDNLEVTILGDTSALVLGHWHLKFNDDSKRDGNFSLVLRKFEDGWKIIHDHSSELEVSKKEVEKSN